MAIKWQQIIDSLESRLKNILISNGFYTDAGNQVYLWRSAPFEVDEMPAINIRDRDDGLRQEWLGNPNRFDHELIVEIDLITASAETLRQMIADVNHAINSDRTFDGLAIDTEYVNVAILTDEHNENIVKGGRLKIQIIYQTEKFEED